MTTVTKSHLSCNVFRELLLIFNRCLRTICVLRFMCLSVYLHFCDDCEDSHSHMVSELSLLEYDCISQCLSMCDYTTIEILLFSFGQAVERTTAFTLQCHQDEYLDNLTTRTLLANIFEKKMLFRLLLQNRSHGEVYSLSSSLNMITELSLVSYNRFEKNAFLTFLVLLSYSYYAVPSL